VTDPATLPAEPRPFEPDEALIALALALGVPPLIIWLCAGLGVPWVVLSPAALLVGAAPAFALWFRRLNLSFAGSRADVRADAAFAIRFIAIVGGVYAAVGAIALAVMHAVSPGLAAELAEAAIAITGGFRETSTLVHALIAAPIAEEIVFRGLVLSVLLSVWSARGWRRPIAAPVVISALAFAAIHGGVPTEQFFGGVVMGIAYARRRRLWIPIALHALGNLIVVLSHRAWLGWPEYRYLIGG
jgi:membrane protease YdiL (CAAX protease family)